MSNFGYKFMLINKITMRKLKLQIHMTIDGFVGNANGEMDWVTFNWDDELRNYSVTNLDQVDCILMTLGHNSKMNFIPYWASVAENKSDPNFVLGKKLTDIPKIVFSRTLTISKWANTKMINGDIVEEIIKLKKQKGNDIIVYGGARFASTLIRHRLIDEFHLLINPVAIGSGLSIFKELDSKQNLTLEKARQFDCGIVVLHYEPKCK
jgi:dihydrofolate reductase